MNIGVVQEPLAFILPKKDTVCLDDKEPVPELPAPAPELPAEESSLEPAAPAFPEEGTFPEEGQEQVESAEPLQADVPSAGT